MICGGAWTPSGRVKANHGRVVGHLHQVNQAEDAELAIVQADEAVGVVDPLLDEVAEDGAGHPWHLDLVQGGQEEAGVVVHGGDDHLDAHRPQLARLHLPGQPLQDQLHENGDHLVDVHSLALQNDHLR